jgi:hypothetical protein
MKTCVRVDVWIHAFLTSALVAGDWSDSSLCSFAPVEIAAGTHTTEGWVDLRTGVRDVEKRKMSPLLGLKFRHLRSPACIEQLCRPRYPGPRGVPVGNILTSIVKN